VTADASSGVPIGLAKTRSRSCQADPAPIRSSSCPKRCSRRAATTGAGIASVRRLFSVFGSTSSTLPASRCSAWRTARVPASRSTSSQRRPSASP